MPSISHELTLTPIFLAQSINHPLAFNRSKMTAARLRTGSNRHHHITPILASLHWLSVRFSIDFKIELITFKACLTTSYKMQMLTPYEPAWDPKSSSGSLQAVPKSRLKSEFGRAFAVRTPLLRNDLPEEMRLSESVARFKIAF